MRSSLLTVLLILGVFIMLAGQSIFSAKADDTDHAKLPVPKMELAADKQTKAGETRSAVFAGGCFWCTEGVFRQFKGVKDVTSGYTGDTKDKATYEAVCSHTTNHAEAIKIVYDPSVITYAQLMQIFFTGHDPTTKDRQGNDSGHQYRSAIFYQSDDEKKVAESYIKQMDEAKAFSSPVVTTLEPLTEFYPAEAYHQDFVAANPNQGYVRACALPKMEKVRKMYKDWLK
jgi:peptide-methionine (S)-S-oxide reductase